MAAGICITAFLPEYDSVWIRPLIKLALIPLTMGVGYELLKLAGKHDNILTRIIGTLYATDSNENVCPSIHVLGAVGAGIAGLQCRRFATVWGRIVMWVSIITICMSTVMIKQHSIIDVFVALALCAVVYPFTFGRKKAFYRPAGQPTAPVAVD